MTKAKVAKTKVQRWVVREHGAASLAWYMLFIGPKPRRREKRWDSQAEGFVAMLCPSEFEQFCPKGIHLPPGGGPIEIRIVKVKAVKAVKR